MTQPSDRSFVVPVNELNFSEEVLESSLPVFIDVSAEWCGPCKVAAPVVANLARRYQGRLKVVEIDGNASPALTAHLAVRGFPTFIGVSQGNIVERQAGFAGALKLDAFAQKLVEEHASVSVERATHL
jgi:thioredoxin 1